MSGVTAVSENGLIPRLGDVAPDFTAQTTHGEVKFHEWQGDKWVILFSHPADFTPVCSTELTAFAKRYDEFEKRGAKLIGISIDSIHAHLAWTQNLERILQTKIPYPLIADLNTAVAQKYGMIHPGASETVTVRTLFVIDPNKKVRALIYYPLNVGRSVDEVLRLLTALQTADTKGVALPVDWKPGDKVIVPPPKTEADVQDRLSGKYEKIDFYLCKKELV
ncbi:MAG TPA: peroxiredoxin [candidate division Zixibacteria bacterium]|jgi:peroxiredoxin (alkyl hydroperoxide reductase subunit C)